MPLNLFRLTKLVSILVSILALTPATVVLAQVETYALPKLEISPLNKILIDNAPYRKQDIIWDFLMVGFNDQLWFQTGSNSPDLLDSYLSERKVLEDSDIGFLTQFLRDKNPKSILPKTRVINKWKKDNISVGIGPIQKGQSSAAKISDETEKRFLKIAREISSNIEVKTGLTIKVLSSGEERDTKNVAKIRIIPVQETYLFNKYKFFVPSDVPRYASNQPVSLAGAVRFTPLARSQVDGFYIPTFDNTIVYAACRIKNDLNEEVQVALMTECLLRSLGLPETSKVPAKSFLGNWNSHADGESKIQILDGDSAEVRSTLTAPSNLTAAGSEVVPDEIQTYASKRTITDLDAIMVKLLYCDEIKAGMDKLEAGRVLVDNPACKVNLID